MFLVSFIIAPSEGLWVVCRTKKSGKTPRNFQFKSKSNTKYAIDETPKPHKKKKKIIENSKTEWEMRNSATVGLGGASLSRWPLHRTTPNSKTYQDFAKKNAHFCIAPNSIVRKGWQYFRQWFFIWQVLVKVYQYELILYKVGQVLAIFSNKFRQSLTSWLYFYFS